MVSPGVIGAVVFQQAFVAAVLQNFAELAVDILVHIQFQGADGLDAGEHDGVFLRLILQKPHFGHQFTAGRRFFAVHRFAADE